jgi:hypothetical protein
LSVIKASGGKPPFPTCKFLSLESKIKNLKSQISCSEPLEPSKV